MMNPEFEEYEGWKIIQWCNRDGSEWTAVRASGERFVNAWRKRGFDVAAAKEWIDEQP